MTLQEAQAEYLIRGRNALETSVVLSEEVGRMFKGRPIMEMACVTEVIRQLNENGIRYAIIGGLAIAHQAIPRTTQDLDLVVLVEDVQKVHALFREYYVKGTAIARVYDYRGTHFDVQPANLRIQINVVQNAEDGRLEGITARVASVKDLLLLKFWSAPERSAPPKRLQDETDVAQLLDFHRDAVTAADIARICQSLLALCYTPEEVNRRKKAIQWLNGILEELGLGDRQFHLEPEPHA